MIQKILIIFGLIFPSLFFVLVYEYRKFRRDIQAVEPEPEDIRKLLDFIKQEAIGYIKMGRYK